MRRLMTNLEQSLVPSLEQREKLRKYWNERLSDPLAFVPIEERQRGITAEEADIENVRFGVFASSYLKKIIGALTEEADIYRRAVTGRKIIYSGFGKGFDFGRGGADSKWLSEATKAGLSTWLIDVSDLACEWAKEEVDRQWQSIPPPPEPIIYYRPIVRQAEIQTLLAEPESVALDLETVEIWYLSRLLGCLPKASAEAVLNQIGSKTFSPAVDPQKKNAVVIVNALCGDNKRIKSDTSRDLQPRDDYPAFEQWLRAIGQGSIHRDLPIFQQDCNSHDHHGQFSRRRRVTHDLSPFLFYICLKK